MEVSVKRFRRYAEFDAIDDLQFLLLSDSYPKTIVCVLQLFSGPAIDAGSLEKTDRKHENLLHCIAFFPFVVI